MSHSTLLPERTLLPRRRWTVEEFQQAARSGVFRPDERLELLEGEIIERMPPDAPHSSATGLVADALIPLAVHLAGHVRTENPIVLPHDGQPQPDAVIVYGDRRRYVARHPEPPDVALVVEVADSSLPEDRSVKSALYATAGIPEYWIANLRDRQVEVHRAPLNGIWTTTFVVSATGSLAALAAPQLSLAVADLLP